MVLALDILCLSLFDFFFMLLLFFHSFVLTLPNILGRINQKEMAEVQTVQRNKTQGEPAETSEEIGNHFSY